MSSGWRRAAVGGVPRLKGTEGVPRLEEVKDVSHVNPSQGQVKVSRGWRRATNVAESRLSLSHGLVCPKSVPRLSRKFESKSVPIDME
jgi:hypothetical protein